MTSPTQHGQNLPGVALHVALELLPGDGPAFRLCLSPTGKGMAWSSRLQPLVFSVADAIRLAPRLELEVQKIEFPAVCQGMKAPHFVHQHGKVSSRLWIIGVSCGSHVDYAELLAACRGEHLPNFWFLHSTLNHRKQADSDHHDENRTTARPNLLTNAMDRT